MSNVLVIDDALTIRKYHKSILEEVGFTVVEAENGIEALEKLISNTISLCLVDVNMPLMDGFTFVKELRNGEIQPDCPVIMVTTESRLDDEQRGYQCGANLYLTKPAAPQSLQSYCKMMARGATR